MITAGHLTPFVQDTVLVSRSTRSSVSSISVPTHGNGVSLSLSASVVELFVHDFTLLVDGEPKAFTTSGGGASWELRFNDDWITADQEVSVAYSGSQLLRFDPTSITNNSVISTRGASIVAQRRSYHVCLSMATHYIAAYGDPGNQFAPGDADPDLFNPTGLTQPSDLDNWMDAAEAFGAESIMVTTKHVCGYCIWDSDITADHSLSASTTWWNANGFDLIDAFTTRARLRGLKVGLYFSVWDKHFEYLNPDWTNSEYTAYVQAQLTEILTNYGVIDEIILDAWAGISTYPSYTEVDKDSTLALVLSLQPNIKILMNDYIQSATTIPSYKDVALYENGLGPVIEAPPVGNRMPARTWMTPTGDTKSWFHDATWLTSYLPVEEHLERIETAASRQSEIMFNLSPDITGLIDSSRISYLAALNP